MLDRLPKGIQSINRKTTCVSFSLGLTRCLSPSTVSNYCRQQYIYTILNRVHHRLHVLLPDEWLHHLIMRPEQMCRLAGTHWTAGH